MEGDKYWRGTAGFIDTTAVKLQSKRPLKLHIRKNCPRIYDFMGRGISIRARLEIRPMHRICPLFYSPMRENYAFEIPFCPRRTTFTSVR